jgi:hypothetical protein
MKKVFVALLLSGAAAVLPAAPDPRAVSVAESMISAMGGKGGWEKARFFRFDFTVVRDGKKLASFSHWWDRYDGRYRVEGSDPKTGLWKAYLNVQTRQGDFFVNGTRAEGEVRAKGLEQAFGRFINDTYWLLAPWKVFDPGVSLEYLGEVKTAAGQECDEIKLSFQNVGLTPKDVYWLDIDKSTHLLDQWKYVLNGGDDPPTVAAWKDWRRFGPIELSTSKPLAAKPMEIRFENVSVTETPDDAALTSPR